MPQKKHDESTTECPNCAESIKLGAILCRFCGAGLSKEFFKECCTCREMIRNDAIKCRYCKASVNGAYEKSSASSYPPIDIQPGKLSGLPRTAPDALPLALLAATDFLPVLRNVERIILENLIQKPIIIFWSKQAAARLFPTGSRFRELMKTAQVSVFSEDRLDGPDEWSYLLLSSDLCFVVYGQQSLESRELYQCTGSIEPALVKIALERLMPRFKELDSKEADRLAGAVSNFTESGANSEFATKPELAESVRLSWPASTATPDLFTGTTGVLLPTGSMSPDAMSQATSITSSIIQEVAKRLSRSENSSLILQSAIESLGQVMKADRVILWQIVGDHLQATHEFSAHGHTCFLGNQLTPHESMAVVFEFLARFPDESGDGVLSIPDTTSDTAWHSVSPTIAALIELANVRSRVMGQIRWAGTFTGFLEVQQCTNTRDWNPVDAAIVQIVARSLALVVSKNADKSLIELLSQEQRLLCEITGHLNRSKDNPRVALSHCVYLSAKQFGFTNFEVYIVDEKKAKLQPQRYQRDFGKAISSEDPENSIAAVFLSKHWKLVNLEYKHYPDQQFGRDLAFLLPLVFGDQNLGVLCFWHRTTEFRVTDRDIGLCIANILATFIQANRAAFENPIKD